MNNTDLGQTYVRFVYVACCCATLLLCLYVGYVDLKEVTDRLAGRNTLFAQMSWLSDKQAIIYSLSSMLFYLLLIVLLISFFLRKKRKQVIIIAAIAWFATITLLLIESRYLDYKN